MGQDEWLYQYMPIVDEADSRKVSLVNLTSAPYNRIKRQILLSRF